jgi:peptide deformylase
MVREVLQLGNPQLYEGCEPIRQSEVHSLTQTVEDLHDTLGAFRRQYGAGRAIAAPQIGLKKRLIYMYIEQPVVFINPVLEFLSDEKMVVLDDCMSFPGLLVKVERYKSSRISYLDLDWQEHTLDLEGDLAELLQHEYDHLDGILATMRAIDKR